MSGFKLARRRDIVSLPPEKIRSTATAATCTMFEALGFLQIPFGSYLYKEYKLDWMTRER